MATLLAHIKVNQGKEARFEEIARDMVAQTASEPGCLRYEYWRGQEERKYYCLLVFKDAHSFWIHQASDYHESYGPEFIEMFEDFVLETVDASTALGGGYPTSNSQDVPGDAPELVKTQAGNFPINPAEWWAAMRGQAGQ